jgi:hypothetical protein
MNVKKIILSLLFPAMLGNLVANPVQLSSSKLRVVYDRQKLSFYMNSSATPFMKEVALAPVELTRSPALGAGEKWHFNVELDSRYKRIELVSQPVGSASKVVSVNWINPGFLK